MSLRATAAADLPQILAADGEDVTVFSHDGASITVKALTQDVFFRIDPNSGQGVAGRQSTVALMPADVASIGEIEAVQSTARKPWTIEVTDAAGTPHRFKVRNKHPDGTRGLTVFELEPWRS